MYYIVTKHDRNFRRRGKCRKNELHNKCFLHFLSVTVVSNVLSVLSQYNTCTWLRPLQLLYDIDVAKNNNSTLFLCFN